MQDDPAGRGIRRLIEIMARLRDPEGGCPWDQAQSFASIAPYTVEEAFEVADAIAAGDMVGLREELGDLLLQVVYHARLAEEAGHFGFTEVAAAIADKMVGRHPRVFGNAGETVAAGQGSSWEALKAAERQRKATADGRRPGLLDGIAPGLTQLLQARKLQERAAGGGFDWPDATGPWDKVNEELAELSAAPQAAREEELGDLMFALVNLARHWRLDPEIALRKANAKFAARFRQMEAWLTEAGRQPADCTLAELETLWQRAKRV